MARFEEIRDRLPTLYRPEAGDTSLLTIFLQAVGEVLEIAHREASDVLQSHWFRYADQALYDAFYLRTRELLGQPVPNPMDPDDQDELERFPYIHDLAWLAELLPLPPWQEPPVLRETGEEYRLRIERMVTVYRNGMGTLQALRGMIEAHLPVDLEALPELQDQPFWIEEYAPLCQEKLPVTTRGAPDGIVGPLMRWSASHVGLQPAMATVYIRGVVPVEGEIEATENPIIELYRAGLTRPRLGIGYQGTLAEEETLRLRPAYSSWLGRMDGVLRSESLPVADSPADPTAPGPWMPVAGGPAAQVVAVCQTHDRALWVATFEDTAGVLWRYDGQAWTSVELPATPAARALVEEGQELQIGTEQGLLRMPLYPRAGESFEPQPVPELGEVAVHALYREPSGIWWVGTSAGLLRGTSLTGGGGDLVSFGLGEEEATATDVYAISQDRSGTFHFGTSLGLFQYQPPTNDWYWYEGKEGTEQDLDWEPFFPERSAEARNFPAEDRVYLPPVRCVHRGPDASLWIGTDFGLARYVARSDQGLTYQTVLEAFPDLVTGRVYDIREDSRGLVWFCTDRGLFRYDGRDMWQESGDTWNQLGRADTIYDEQPEPRGSWRFERASERWQRFNPATSTWISHSGEKHSAEAPPVLAVCWTDSVAADIGDFASDESPWRFTPSAPVETSHLLMRYKPSEDRIVTGGLPAVPRLPNGSSTWRYLSLEPDGLRRPSSEHLPAWTIEGRLIPPPAGLHPPYPGRFGRAAPPLTEELDGSVFAYSPAAQVWFAWQARQTQSVLVRLRTRTTGEKIDPAVLDRVWQGIEQVRPAGVRAVLAVDDRIVRGGNDG